jgi:hypothetical protein
VVVVVHVPVVVAAPHPQRILLEPKTRGRNQKRHHRHQYYYHYYNAMLRKALLRPPRDEVTMTSSLAFE